MNIFEIKAEMQSLIDMETGELLDYDAFQELQMAHDEKIENALLWSKELDAEAEAIKAEIEKLTERKRAAEKKADSLRTYVEKALEGAPFKTARVEIKYRKSTAVEIEDEVSLLAWALTTDRRDLLIEKEPSISKKAVGDALKAGMEIPGARLAERINMRVI